MFYYLARFILRFLLYLRQWQIEGLRNLSYSQGLIVVSNHTSYWDPVIVGCALNRPVHYMAKAELFKNPLLALLFRTLKAFPVERGKSDRKAIRHAVNLLAEGNVLGIFPEGTRSTSGELQKAHLGAAMLAFKGNASIIPVGISGARGLLNKPKVVIGDPITLPQYAGGKPSREQLIDFSEQVMSIVAELMAKANLR